MSRHHHHPPNRRGWQSIRSRELKAAGRRCARCGRPGRLEIHHVKPLSEGDDDAQEHEKDLQVFCRECHLQKHHTPDPAREEWARFLIEEFSTC